MHAYIIAHGVRTELAPLNTTLPSSLFPILGKPILFHLFDKLFKKKIAGATLALHHLPEQFEEVRGDGNRWSFPIDVVLTHSVQEPIKELLIHAKETATEEWYIFASADRIPVRIPDKTTPFVIPYSFALLPQDLVQGLPLNMSENMFWLALETLVPKEDIATISAQSLKDLLHSNIDACINPRSVELPSEEKQIMPGVWVAKETIIDASAKLIPPVVIGKGTKIEHNTICGPKCVIGQHSVIAANTNISSSLVLEKSYVGECLDIKESVVSGNTIANFTHNEIVLVPDAFLLSPIRKITLSHHLFSCLEQLVGLFLLLLVSPVSLYFRFQGKRSGPWIFIDNRYAALFANLAAIACGEAHFVGLKPLTIEKINSLPDEVQYLYATIGIGWAYLPENEQDTSYSAAFYFAAKKSFFFKLKLFLSALIKF